MMNIASRCKTLFYRLVAVGLGVTYGFQVFLTVGGAIKLIPMTGVTLPFVSYGGSSIISSLVMFALINGMYNMRLDESGMKMTEKVKMQKNNQQQKQRRKRHRGVKKKETDIVEGSKKGLRNRETNIISFVFIGLFAIMIVYLCVFNIKDAKDVINNPYNKKNRCQADKVVRGDICLLMEQCLQRLMRQMTVQRQECIHRKKLFSVIGYNSRTKMELVNRNYYLLSGDR